MRCSPLLDVAYRLTHHERVLEAICELLCGESNPSEMAVGYLELIVKGEAQRLLHNNSNNNSLGIWNLWEHGIFSESAGEELFFFFRPPRWQVSGTSCTNR